MVDIRQLGDWQVDDKRMTGVLLYETKGYMTSCLRCLLYCDLVCRTVWTVFGGRDTGRSTERGWCSCGTLQGEGSCAGEAVRRSRSRTAYHPAEGGSPSYAETCPAFNANQTHLQPIRFVLTSDLLTLIIWSSVVSAECCILRCFPFPMHKLTAKFPAMCCIMNTRHTCEPWAFKLMHSNDVFKGVYWFNLPKWVYGFNLLQMGLLVQPPLNKCTFIIK